MTILVAVLLALLPSLAVAKTVTGRIEAYVVESVTPDGRALHAQSYGVRRSARRAPVRIVNPDARLHVGATMRVRGTLDAERTAVTMDADAKGATLLRPSTTALALGTSPMTVVHLAFSDAPRTRTLGSVLAVQRELAAWYAAASHGQWTFTPLGVSATAPVPQAAVECDFTPYVVAGLAAADPQVDYRATPLVNIVLPVSSSPCKMAGGGMATIGPALFQTDDGKVLLGVTLTREDWGPSVHELGHALGLTHAMSMTCPAPGYPANPRGCVNDEYGDPFDPMGSGWGSTFQAANQVQLGWMDRPPLVTTPGFYRLAPVSAPDGLRALRFAARGRQVWLDARGPVGVDATSAAPGHVDFPGLHAHADLAPQTVGGRVIHPGDMETFAPALAGRFALPVGSTLTLDGLRVFVQYRNADGTTGLSITAVPSPTPQPTPTPTVFDGCCSTEPFCPGPSGWYCYRYDPGDPESGGGGGCWRDAACP